jgi:hypothetical protein
MHNIPVLIFKIPSGSVAELHYFYATPAPSKNYDAAPGPTLLQYRYCIVYIAEINERKFP